MDAIKQQIRVAGHKVTFYYACKLLQFSWQGAPYAATVENLSLARDYVRDTVVASRYANRH